MSEIGRLVRQTREGQGLSRRELADRTGLSYPYLQQVEAGSRSPSSKTLALVAEALGLPLEQLLVASGEHAELARSVTSGPPVEAMYVANPAYLGVAGSAPSAPQRRGPGLDRAVDRAHRALDELPPEQRLEAVGVLLSRVLSDAVEDRVRRLR